MGGFEAASELPMAAPEQNLGSFASSIQKMEDLYDAARRARQESDAQRLHQSDMREIENSSAIDLARRLTRYLIPHDTSPGEHELVAQALVKLHASHPEIEVMELDEPRNSSDARFRERHIGTFAVYVNRLAKSWGYEKKEEKND